MDSETATNPVGGDDTLADDTAGTVTTDQEVDTEAGEAAEIETDDEGNPIERAEPEEEFEEVERGGKKYKVPKALAPELMMQADYTRKTQELAEARRSVQAERENVQQASQAELQAQAAVIALDQQIAEFQKVDWEAYFDQDPLQAPRDWARYQQLQQNRGQAASQFVQLRHQRTLAQQQETARLVEEGQRLLARDIKGWSPQLAESLLETGVREYGFERGEIEEFTDPRMVKVLHDAHQWRQSQKKSQQAQKHADAQQTKPAARVGGGAAPASGLDDRLSMDEWQRRRNAQVKKRA